MFWVVGIGANLTNPIQGNFRFCDNGQVKLLKHGRNLYKVERFHGK